MEIKKPKRTSEKKCISSIFFQILFSSDDFFRMKIHAIHYLVPYLKVKCDELFNMTKPSKFHNISNDVFIDTMHIHVICLD